ncbi:hypothetical protein T265_14195 [Opisthorchis viverrini]|uniref:Mediator of RNA polymerase II transcription subunit 17 n=1 Tax=Opisthorchis viverrini TaxID=6198 RepID=A0A074ZIA0_OPIVI|nr:hypothetical protein T265_14195 [Opisthorchis viverrini]KER25527.1 hypothetical protein T265_14195 [Opisthorchis viverrini]
MLHLVSGLAVTVATTKSPRRDASVNVWVPFANGTEGFIKDLKLVNPIQAQEIRACIVREVACSTEFNPLEPCRTIQLPGQFEASTSCTTNGALCGFHCWPSNHTPDYGYSFTRRFTMLGPYPQQPIPIEALPEYDVQEILLDGRELLEKPPTPAEHFQKIVNRIDFTKSYDGSCRSDVTESSGKSAARGSLKMWNVVRETSRMALTEINALVDILAVLKEEKYLSVFPVATDPPDLNPAIFLVGKKQALAAASEILLKGTERLRRRHAEVADARSRTTSSANNSSDRSKTASTLESFHKTLMQLRQEWRLKLHQNTIIGDVSLRAIGSRFRESGNFEVRESDMVALQKSNNSGTNDMEVSGSVEVVFSRSVEALLNNTVGSGLLTVEIHETGTDSGPVHLWDCVFNANSGTSSELTTRSSSAEKLSQRERLLRTQRLLACREILHTLSFEAFSSKSRLCDSSCFATQDRVIANLLPGVQLTISLETRPPPSDSLEIELEESKPLLTTKPTSSSKSDGNNRVHVALTLSLQLNRLLAAQHRVVWPNLASLPTSACGAVQIPARNRAAGAHALHASHFNPSGSDVSAFSIAVASVAGFAGPATAAWSTHNIVHRSTTGPGDRSDPTVMATQRLPSASITQDRLALFTEWGTLQTCSGMSSSAIQQSTVGPAGSQIPYDDSVYGTSKVASVEHLLHRKKADDGAIQSVLGSTSSLLDRIVAISRHYFLRNRVFDLLVDFVQNSPIRVIVHWDGLNTALVTSARICFYAVNYDAYRSWIGLTVTHTGMCLFYPDPPRSCYVGMDFSRLRMLLRHQVVYTQLYFLDVLITKILGWTRLGNNPFSGIADLEDVGDAPVVVKLFASPSGRTFVCLWASGSTALRLFVSDRAPASLDHLGSIQSRASARTDSCRLASQGFREVHLRSVRGGIHDVARIEAVMTSLP